MAGIASAIYYAKPAYDEFFHVTAKEEAVEMGGARRTVEETARQILRYLTRQPEAEDTLEGIARWWLQRERIERTVDEVGQSLQLLLSHDLIVEERGMGRNASYRMNPAKRREIGKYIR